jgi:hypothetical protein
MKKGTCWDVVPCSLVDILTDVSEELTASIISVISRTLMMEAWTEIDKIHSRFCKKVLGILRCAANGAVEIELSRERRRGKIMDLILKY